MRAAVGGPRGQIKYFTTTLLKSEGAAKALNRASLTIRFENRGVPLDWLGPVSAFSAFFKSLAVVSNRADKAYLHSIADASLGVNAKISRFFISQNDYVLCGILVLTERKAVVSLPSR
jgi:hypothetical protein